MLSWLAGHVCSIRAGACAPNEAKVEGCQDLARQGSHSHCTSELHLSLEMQAAPCMAVPMCSLLGLTAWPLRLNSRGVALQWCQTLTTGATILFLSSLTAAWPQSWRLAEPPTALKVSAALECLAAPCCLPDGQLAAPGIARRTAGVHPACSTAAGQSACSRQGGAEHGCCSANLPEEHGLGPSERATSEAGRLAGCPGLPQVSTALYTAPAGAPAAVLLVMLTAD